MGDSGPGAAAIGRRNGYLDRDRGIVAHHRLGIGTSDPDGQDAVGHDIVEPPVFVVHPEFHL